MGISVCEENPEDIKKLLKANLKLWEDPVFAKYIGGAQMFVARQGQSIVGTWLVPIEHDAGQLIARRSVRVLPYASPLILEGHPKKRRQILMALFRHIQSEFSGIELPLSVGFHDLGAFAEAGAFLEARQTHIVRPSDVLRGMLTRKARNALRSASVCDIVVRHTVEGFDFDQAIVDAPREHVETRRAFATLCERKRNVVQVTANFEGKIAGQALALCAHESAYMMHAWRDNDLNIRGVPTLLVMNLAEHLFGPNFPECEELDLEGSIIARVDHFMDGLGAIPKSYANVFWYRNRADLMKRLEGALDIPGRLAVDYTSGN